jgi:hypothetical protein
LLHEIDNLRQDFQLSSYPVWFIDSVLKSRGNSYLREEEKPFGVVSVLCVRDISEKFKCMGNHYNVKTVFKTRHTLKYVIMSTRSEKAVLQQMTHCIIAFAVNVGEAVLGKQADHWLCDFMSIGTICEWVFKKNQNWPIIPVRRVTG